mmetsp:Transcript_40045/g.61237  ORF Transcript_40045/g.61237 Transcript_40045/m.61237 type:complete len:181 (+) Transcript_40045:437-979(+)
MFKELQFISDSGSEFSQSIVSISKDLTSKGHFNDAREFIRYCNSKIEQIEVLREGARVMFVMRYFRESIEYFEKVGQLERFANHETFSDMARCVFEMGKIDLAESEGFDYANRALQLNSKSTQALLNKGNLLELAGQADKALVCYEKALAIEPNLLGAIVNMGNLLYEKEQYEEACLKYL